MNRPRIARRRLERLYGLTQEDHGFLLASQGGRCAICRRDLPLCVDHNHDTGVVRGLLCHDCNLGLGRFADDPGRLLAAAKYLAEKMNEAYGNTEEGTVSKLHG